VYLWIRPRLRKIVSDSWGVRYEDSLADEGRKIGMVLLVDNDMCAEYSATDLKTR
jgi:hypothetical protein